jgi:DNA mismatch repair protein MutS2
MNPATLERLEFPQLKELLGARLTCAPGRQALAALAPSTDRAWVENELERVAEARAFLDQGQESGFGGLTDPALLLAKLGVSDVVLSPQELLDLASLLTTSTSTRQLLGAPRFRELLPRLRELAAELGDFTALERNIRRRILPGGEIDNHASPTLAEIRAAIEKTERKLHRTLKRLLKEAAARAALQDEYVTLRGGRLVLPIRADARTRPDGVVHAASGTGQTLFLEPLETIALNHELVRLREEEAAEIRRILRSLTDQLAQRRVELERAAQVIGALDLIFARARYGRDFGCAIPRLDGDHWLRLTAVRHPLLEAAIRAAKRKQSATGWADGNAVPISLQLDRERRLLVISGPNAGGKTAALKTLGLAALAAQAGIPVPAEEARLPVFEHILADIGDEQSLVENLSTFSAHILNLREMAEEAGEESLVLLDELGAATSPEEGAALGIALLEHFRQRGAMTVATTHHERLKAYAASTPGALNAAVEFDEVKLQPTYRLRVGVPGVSSGLEMAARLGLSGEIVEAARNKLTTEATETAALIRSLHQTQQELERLQEEVRGELQRLQQERERLERQWLREQRHRLAEVERSLQATVAECRKEMQRVVAGLKEPAQRSKLERAGARQLRRVEAETTHSFESKIRAQLGESAAGQPTIEVQRVSLEELQLGARVKLRGIARRGVVLSRQGADAVEVQIGSLRMRARAEDIEAVERVGKEQTPRARMKVSKTAETPRTQSTEVAELQVRGLRVEEALETVDKFLDQAALSGATEVRIVHGIGKGALKKALAEFLAEHPHVESLREAEPERGGAGATIATLQRN